MRIGGAERQLKGLIQSLDLSRFHPVLLTIREKGHFYKELEREGFDVYCLAERPQLNIAFFSSLLKVLQLVRKYRFHVIQTMEFNADTLGRLAAVFSRIPVRLVADHYTGFWEPRGYRPWVNKILLRVTDAVIFVAGNQKKLNSKMYGIAPEKGVVIYNGVDPGEFALQSRSSRIAEEFDLRENEKTIGIIAVLRPEKAHDVFLEMAAKILKRFPGTKFIIVGDGERREELETLAESLGVASRVVFTGFRHDIDDIMSVLDIVMLSSHPKVESFPMCLLEAMSMGKPVVATEVSGVPELVAHGETGYVTPHGDAAALADAVGNLLSDPELMKRFGSAGRRRVEERFTLEKMTRNYEKLYISLLREKGKLPRAEMLKSKDDESAGADG